MQLCGQRVAEHWSSRPSASFTVKKRKTKMVMVLTSEPVRKVWDPLRWDVIHSEVFNFSSFKVERYKPLLTLLPCDSRLVDSKPLTSPQNGSSVQLLPLKGKSKLTFLWPLSQDLTPWSLQALPCFSEPYCWSSPPQESSTSVPITTWA